MTHKKSKEKILGNTIKERIKLLEEDKRIYYKPANVFTNAPLALIQTDIIAQLATLYWLLGEEVPNYAEIGKRRNNDGK